MADHSPTDLRNLPPEVLERLATPAPDDDAARARARVEVVQRGRLLEARAWSRSEIRRDEDGNPIIDGYATVYDVAYDVAGGPPWGWSETIVGGACQKSVASRDDVRFLVNHDGLALARTKSRTLTLESDQVGLRTEAHLDAKSFTVNDLVSAMERGDMDEMSFAFRVIRQEWNDDFTERQILEVKLYDVSVVTYPANPYTVAQVRDAAPAAPVPVMSLARARAERELMARELERLRTPVA